MSTGNRGMKMNVRRRGKDTQMEMHLNTHQVPSLTFFHTCQWRMKIYRP